MKTEDIRECLAVLAANYGDFVIVAGVTERIWAKCFEGADGRAIKAAVFEHITTSSKRPTIADINQALSRLRSSEGHDEFGAALEEIRRAVQRYSIAEEKEALQSLSPVTRAAMQRYGWREWGLGLEADRGTRIAQFRAIWSDINSRTKRQETYSPSLLKASRTLSDRLLSSKIAEIGEVHHATKK